MTDYEALRPWATPSQMVKIDALKREKSGRKAAKSLGLDERNFWRSLKRLRDKAARQGFSPDHDMTRTAPDGYHVKGTSTYYDSDGNPTAQWVKTNIDHQRQIEMMQEAAEAFTDDLPKITPPKYTIKKPDKDVIPWFQIGDGHIGMLAHEAEVGHNFDLKIAESELCAAMAILIDETRPCERCVINDLGDMTHYENYRGETDLSGHKLDYDGRFPKMVHVYVRVMRFIVERAMKRFKHVDVIINQGNHSRTNDIWMRQLLKHVYGDTRRVNVLDNSSVFIPYRMGNTFVMTHHSDKCKPNKLADVMASDFSHDWGESKYRYIDIGHIHHRMQAKEMAGVTIESWNQLAPMDKYAHDGGWRSRSCLQVVERSKTYGEIARRTLPVERVQDVLNKARPGDAAKQRREVFSV